MKYIKFPKIPFIGKWSMSTKFWPQKSASMYLEMHLTDAMKYIEFKKQFHYLADGNFQSDFFSQNSIFAKLIKICVADFYETLHDDALS